MATKDQVLRTIHGPFSDYLKFNTNIVTVETQGLATDGDYQAMVGVRSVETERMLRSLGTNNFAVPRTLALKDDARKLPIEVEVPFEIFEVGDVRAFTNIRASGPCPPGYSIGHSRVTAGTLGCLLEHSSDPSVRYILSNNHVLAASNRGRKGDPILQPGRHDGGTIADAIATLEAFEPLEYVSTNSVDAAIALVGNNDFPPDEWSQLVKPGIPGIGNISGFADPVDGMHVCKVGRSTNLTYGRIVNSHVPIVEPNYGPGLGILTFIDQIRTTPMATDGDSGSVLVDVDTLKIVGLLFSGSDLVTYFNPIKRVLSILAAKLDDDRVGTFGPG